MSTPRRHRVSLRVRFSETDAMGVANNGVYLAWLEIARIEYLRALGHSYRDVHDGGHRPGGGRGQRPLPQAAGLR